MSQTQRTTSRQAEALHNATTSQAMSNYPAIFAGFTAKGIAEDAIKPRENVFTYHAWKALGRQVRKGEHGIRIITWITCKKREADQEPGEPNAYRRPKQTTVFHETQTDAAPDATDQQPTQ
jgi:antirestriction protein ArdC